MPTNFYIQHQRAFSLLELLIALALTSIILLGVFNIYLALKALDVRDAHNNLMQDHMRFLSNFLQHNIELAGYAGCGQVANLNLVNTTNLDFSYANSVRGFSSNNLPQDLQSYQIAPNTDVIVIEKADEDINQAIDEKISHGATSFHAKENPATIYNKFLLLEDCRNADLFLAKNVGGGVVRANRKISHDYSIGPAQVSRFTKIAYFISQNSNDAADLGRQGLRKNPSVASAPLSLYSRKTGFQGVAQIDPSSLEFPRGAPAVSKRSILNICEHYARTSCTRALTGASGENAPRLQKSAILPILCEQGRNKAENQNATGIYYAVNDGDKEALAFGVTNMQIKYGVAAGGNGAVNHYYTAPEVDANNAWGDVQSVVLTLTLDDANDVAGKFKPVTFDVYIKLRER